MTTQRKKESVESEAQAKGTSMSQQLTIFDELCDKFSITKPIRLIELFAGYGSQAMALKRWHLSTVILNCISNLEIQLS